MAIGGIERRRMLRRGTGPLGLVLAVAGAVAASVLPAALPAQDTTPHSDARLISETAALIPGEPFTLGIHITLDPGWHTYWKNAGDAGAPLVASWSLPEGVVVDSLLHPWPERIPYPPLVNYGYNDEVVFLVPGRAAGSLRPGDRARIAADLEFLVCEDICIPASARVSIELPVVAAATAAGGSKDASLIDRYRDRLPIRSDAWEVRAARTESGFVLGARPPGGWPGSMGGAYFFPADPAALDHAAPQPVGRSTDGEARLRLTESPYLEAEPDRMDGLLVLPEGSAFDAAGHRALEVAVPVETGATAAWAQEPTTPIGAPRGTATASTGGVTLLAALLFALVGGVILNLMPCVFPILSLKALGFAGRGGDRAGMRRDGLAFGAGVVLSFLAVAALLMAVRATGAEVGWGYQLQSPGIVAALAALMFAIGLVLLGAVEVGTSLTRLGGIGGGEGPGSAFLTGVLATVVATPCTAPFMGAAVGTALVRPPVEGLSIFAGLGVGMAAPYVALAFWPALARRLPKPGRWMETFRQALAFPMFAVAVWLVWVFGLQVGVGGSARLLFALLLLALAVWILGRWPATSPRRPRLISRAAALAVMIVAVLAGVAAAAGDEPLPSGETAESVALEWGEFSEEAVASYRAVGRPVFVDFTAAWCISCKVNERVALETAAVREAFADAGVALLKADWTRRDPAITRALASFGRSGVPLYVLYPADPAAEPVLLPSLLTPGIVLSAVAALPEPEPLARAGLSPGP
ncbi:MAG: thioredoxin family protein [Gemmatimonadetes bacterium]|nr:thioredoxin family protein [Gemmatimonadota bacterium]